MLRQKSWLLSWIVFLKGVQPAALAALGAFLFGYLHRDSVELVVRAADYLNLPSTSGVFTRAIAFAMGLTVGKQIALAVTSFGYAIVLGIEAVGLAMRRGW